MMALETEEAGSGRPKRSLSNSKKEKKQQKNAKRNQDSWIFLAKDELLSSAGVKEKDDCKSLICRLRHPRRNEGTLYVLSPDQKNLYELNSFKEQYRSWFIGSTVHSDGQIYMSTLVDPVFLALPYLINAASSNRFMSLDQIICDEEFPDCCHLLACSGMDQLRHVADVKDIDEDLKVYRYNIDKTLSLLEAKTNAAVVTLKEKNVNTSSGSSHSAMFIRSNKSDGPSHDDYVEFAFGLICDYLTTELEAKLKDHLGIKEKAPASKADTAENEPPSKKQKTEEAVLEDYSKQYDLKKEKSKAKLTAAQKKLSKVDKSGMKSISSFFSPKS